MQERRCCIVLSPFFQHWTVRGAYRSLSATGNYCYPPLEAGKRLPTGRTTMSVRVRIFRRSLVAAGAAAAGCLAMVTTPAGADPGDVTFTEMFDFEEYSTGGLDGQDVWSAIEAAQVVPDPLNGNN